MDDFFLPFTRALAVDRVTLPLRFDAERDTPALIDAVSVAVPPIRGVLASLRTALPLVPHSGAGAIGNFFRIPNHYRSVSFVLPAADSGAPDAVAAAIVFKGTEPLLRDFPNYLEWMLRAPFRGSYLPLGLHYPLEIKLPPAAMWIEECVTEQEVTSSIQMVYFKHYGNLARLPVPLLVYQFTTEQVQRYEAIVRARVSAAAFKRFEAKVAGGLGIEVYYYPTVPVRAADLSVSGIKSAFESCLNAAALDSTFNNWIELMADLLHLGYMPYAPWNHGMGACVDPGNACVDGGFNDLLTIVPFDAIPGEHLFWRSLSSSVQLLASSIVAMCAATTNSRPWSQSDPIGVAIAYVMERLRTRILSYECQSHPVDDRLAQFFEEPSVHDVLRHLRETHREGGSPGQYPYPQAEPPTQSSIHAEPSILRPEESQAIGA